MANINVGKGIPSVGDVIRVTFLGAAATGQVFQAESYRNALILGYRTAGGQTAWATCFPGWRWLPQPQPGMEHLFCAAAWLYWEKRIWPVAVANPIMQGTRLLVDNNEVTHARQKIDHVLTLKLPTEGMTIAPGNDWEYRRLQDWFRSEGL